MGDMDMAMDMDMDMAILDMEAMDIMDTMARGLLMLNPAMVMVMVMAMVMVMVMVMDMAMVMGMEDMAMDMVVMDIVDTMERGLLMLSPAMDMVMAMVMVMVMDMVTDMAIVGMDMEDMVVMDTMDMDIATDIMDKVKGKTDGVLLICDTKSSMTEHKKLIYRNLVLFSLVTFDNK